MPNQSLAKGIFLAVVAVVFSVYALQYDIGSLTNAGPGLFPLAISGLLLLLALIMIASAGSRGAGTPRLSVKPRNIGLIMAALAAFVVCAKYVSTVLGIVLLVVIAGYAAGSASWKRNLQVSAGLIAIAYVFERYLGLNLRLFAWRF